MLKMSSRLRDQCDVAINLLGRGGVLRVGVWEWFGTCVDMWVECVHTFSFLALSLSFAPRSLEQQVQLLSGCG